MKEYLKEREKELCFIEYHPYIRYFSERYF
jgi:hypothetical protein